LLETEQPEKAQVWFERIIRLTPWDVEAHTGLGTALRDQGKLDEAMASYRRALEIDPYFSQARFALAGILYEDKKDYRAAYDEYRFISEENPQFHEAGEAKKLAHRIKKKHL
jgi:tetratricopeptide (TPR) repeat protein